MNNKLLLLNNSHSQPPPFIPTFTREQICNPQITFSGLTISTQQFGEQPWFELAWQCLANKSDRDWVLAQKREFGDTAQIIEFFTDKRKIYDEPGVWLNQCTTEVGEFNPDGFLAFVIEIQEAGMVPVVVYDGDDGDNFPYGYQNALRQLPIVTNLLTEYNHNILYGRFWDGVFYGTSPAQIKHFGMQFRRLLPLGHLAIEFNPGHIPTGGGEADYEIGGTMTEYDVVVAEFDWPTADQVTPNIVAASWDDEHGYTPVWEFDATNWLNVWQIVARLVPFYTAPSNQPFNVSVRASNGPQTGQMVNVSSDSTRPPYFMRYTNARGRYYFWAMELGEYQWTRREITYGQLVMAGRYFKKLGCYNIGFPF